jgi:hypothetical protein
MRTRALLGSRDLWPTSGSAVACTDHQELKWCIRQAYATQFWSHPRTDHRVARNGPSATFCSKRAWSLAASDIGSDSGILRALRMIRRNLFLAMLALTTFAGCSNVGDTSSVTSQVQPTTCIWPPSANTLDDASGIGCTPKASFNICGGGVVAEDGAILAPDGGGATGTCRDACSPSEYALICVDPHGDPNAALGCKVIPVPTPRNALFYCCPCAR